MSVNPAWWNCWPGSRASISFEELRLCGDRSRRAPAAPGPCIIRSRHQRYS